MTRAATQMSSRRSCPPCALPLGTSWPVNAWSHEEILRAGVKITSLANPIPFDAGIAIGIGHGVVRTHCIGSCPIELLGFGRLRPENLYRRVLWSGADAPLPPGSGGALKDGPLESGETLDHTDPISLLLGA